MLQGLREGAGRWIAISVLGLIAVSFIFWGIDFTTMGTTFAARVNGREISLEEFEREVQAQQAQYQELYRIELTDELREEIRRSVLERLIRQQALLDRVQTSGYRISDQRLTEFVRSVPTFQVDGEFSMDVYRAQLLYQGWSPAGFEALQREQLELLELQEGIVESTFYMPNEFRRYIELFNQRREIAYALFVVDDLLDEIEVSEAAVLAHYEANQERYLSEEAVDLEYVEVTGADIAAEIEVTEDILEAYYEEEKYRFQTEEQRQARHILFSEDDDAEAEAQAAEALSRIEAGEDFEALARELSDDVGTKAEGGDLGWVGRGMLVGPFEDTLFAMETGEVRGPVETDFGYHLIRLEEVRPGEIQPFEAVRDELAGDYQNRQAEELFYDRATDLADLAFEAFNELATVATRMNLPLKNIDGFTRSQADELFSFGAPVVQAAFSREVLELGENSALVELDEDHVLVLRVTAHYPAAQQAFEEVREEVEQELARTRAEAEAEARATSLVAEIDQEADVQALTEERGGTWAAPTWMERTSADVTTEILATAFRLDKPRGAPIIERVPMANGDQAVLVLQSVEPGQPQAVAREERDRRLSQLSQRSGMFELAGYAGELREKANVRIPEEIYDPGFYSPLGGF